MRFRSNNAQLLLLEHMDIVLQTLSYLKDMLESLRISDMNKVRDINTLIDKTESLADEIHRKNVEKICKGSMFGYIREDILSFMELIDNIADAVKEAARVLTVRTIPKEMLERFLDDDILLYVEQSIIASKRLKVLIEHLNSKKEEIIEYIKSIEDIEEENDKLKNVLLERLYNNSNIYDILTILQFKEFIHLIDTIADNSEDASDIVLTMVAKGYA